MTTIRILPNIRCRDHIAKDMEEKRGMSFPSSTSFMVDPVKKKLVKLQRGRN